MSYREHKTNEYAWQPTGQYLHLTSGGFTFNLHSLSWFSHVCRHDTLPKIILRGTVDGSRRRGRPRKSWKDKIKEWIGQSMSSLLHITGDRERERNHSA